LLELKLTRLLFECITGHSTILFRAPYNADSEPTTFEEIIPVALARQNYLDVGENIDPEDWKPGIKADEIVARIEKQLKNVAEILFFCTMQVAIPEKKP
jgi:peptidoglycan/xylan/chitin deacetylase (PgdA/CDA1 family)